MLLAEEVVHCLNGVERGDRHFDEDGVPLGHSSVPQSGQFERQQFLAVFGLIGDESRLRIHKVWQVERLAFDITDGADEVHGVEVGRFGHERGVADLRRFEDLAADGTVGIAHEERSSTGFAGILHHAADTDRPIQFGAFFVGEVRVLERFKDTLLLGDQHAGEDLLVTNGVFLEPVGHYIVDIFDEDDVGILAVEVLDERSVSTRTEEKLAILSAERCTVRISGDRIGTRQLLGESDIIADVVFVFKLLEVISYMLAEERQVVV